MAYVISAVVLLVGVASFFHGFRYGVEFSGGRSYVVNFGKAVNAEEIRNALEKTFGKHPVIKTYGGDDKLNITTDYRINDAGLNVDSAVQSTLFTGLKPSLPPGTTKQDFDTRLLEGSNKVNPTISDDLLAGAKWATFWSMLIIAISYLHPFPRLEIFSGNHHRAVARRIGDTGCVLVPERRSAFPAGN